METNNPNSEEFTLEKNNGNYKSVICVMPTIIFFAIFYMVFWHQNIVKGFSFFVFENFYITLLILILGIILHELIHGLFWSFYVKNGFRSIKFGIMKSSITPYCHCKEIMKLWHYIVGSIMPGALLGFLPLFISLITGSFGLFIFGLIFLIGASSDLLMIWKIRKQNKTNWVQDHPEKIGCIIFKNNPNH